MNTDTCVERDSETRTTAYMHVIRLVRSASINENGPDSVRQHHVSQGLTPNEEGL